MLWSKMLSSSISMTELVTPTNCSLSLEKLNTVASHTQAQHPPAANHIGASDIHIHSPHGHATLEDPRAGELEKQRPWWQREDSLMDVLNTLQLSLKLHYENEAHHSTITLTGIILISLTV